MKHTQTSRYQTDAEEGDVNFLPPPFPSFSMQQELNRPTWKDKAAANINSTFAYVTGMALNSIYTISVSVLFASFACRRAQGNASLGAFYAICSFIMNASMAWFFSEKAITSVKRLGKKNPILLPPLF